MTKEVPWTKSVSFALSEEDYDVVFRAKTGMMTELGRNVSLRLLLVELSRRYIENGNKEEMI